MSGFKHSILSDPPIFSEMAGLIMSGLYTGNNQYVGENV